MSTQTFKGLAVGNRLDVLNTVALLGTADRKQILSALNLDSEMMSPDWQKIKRHTIWLTQKGLLLETTMERGRKVYTVDKEKWKTFLEGLI